VLYEALSGRTPFAGAPLDVLMNKLRDEPPPPRQIAPDIPRDLDGLCADLLRVDVRSRPPGLQVLARLGVHETSASSVDAVAAPTASVPFVGRQQELLALQAAFDESCGGQAVTMLVHGESGLGKTALVRKLLEDLERRDNQVLAFTGRCYERES